MAPARKKLLICCVPKCHSRENLFGDDVVKLYKFPSEKPLMRKWVAQIGRGSNFIPTDRSRVCSLHFQTGRRSYKPTNVDYIPSIFWYNQPKTSEYCSECRRKICKCDRAEETSEESEVPSGIVFNEKEMFQLLQTIEAETEDLEDANDIVNATTSTSTSFDLSKVQLMEHDQDHSGDADVTTAIASFLAEQYIPPDEELSSMDVQVEDTKDTDRAIEQSHILFEEPDPQILESEFPPLEMNSVDETIDSVLRGEDSVGEDILLQQFIVSRYPPQPADESENMETSSSYSSAQLKTLSDLEFSDFFLAPNTESVSETSSNTPLEDKQKKFLPPPPPQKPPQLKPPTTIEELRLDPNKMFLQLGSDEAGPTDSELEKEWKRRERKLVKQHKTEEKKMVLEIVRNNQVKNHVIDDLKSEIKELKKEKKSVQSAMENLEKQFKVKYEECRKFDFKNLLDEANANLISLQAKWGDEKRVLIEANAALADLCKNEVSTTELQAEFINSVIAATRSDQPPLASILHSPNAQIRPSRLLQYENCNDSSDFIKYFTGMPTVEDFDSFFCLLEDKAKSMRYWNGKAWLATPQIEKRPRTQRIDHRNQLFLTMVRYKRGFTTKELGYFFNVDPVYISCLFITFSKLIENELVEMLQREYDHANEFNGLPEIVQNHYPSLYATLRVVEIRLENRPVFVTLNPTKSVPKKVSPVFKVLILCSPNGRIFFISSIFTGKTSDRDVILKSKVLEIIPSGSEVFVNKEFEVAEECILKNLQLHVFPQEAYPQTLTEDDPWEIKLMIKCKSRIEKMVGLMRYFRIFDNELHLTGANHTPMVIRVVLLLQNYIDTKCSLSFATADNGNIVWAE